MYSVPLLFCSPVISLVAFICIAVFIYFVVNLLTKTRKMSGFQSEVIKSLVAQVREDMVKNVVDKLRFESHSSEYISPKPEIFRGRAYAHRGSISGVMDFDFDDLNMSLSEGKFIFDVYIPMLEVSLGLAGVEAVVLGHKVEAEVGGWIRLIEPRLKGELGLKMENGELDVEDVCHLAFTIKQIKSAVKLSLLGTDYSNPVNNFLQKTLTDSLKTHEKQFGELLVLIAKKINQDMLNDMLKKK